MRNKLMPFAISIVLALSMAGGALAQDFSIDWWTVDGGGAISSTGGDFELSGTIGQPDAGSSSGGDFELDGGFWGIATMWLLGDMNCDGVIDGFDIDPFVLAMFSQDDYEAAYPDCDFWRSDLNCDGAVDGFDIDGFVACMLVGGPCECP